MIVEPSGIFEIFLRLGGAVALTISASWLWALIYQKRMVGGWVWPYFASVIAALAGWRWIVLALAYPDLWPGEWIENLTPFIQPINASLYFLLGFSVIILTYAHLKGVEQAKFRRAKHLVDHGPYDQVPK